MGSDFTETSNLYGLLTKYKHVFGKKESLTHLISHKIENSAIAFSKPRRQSQSEANTVNKLTQEMLKENIIRPSSSPYNSPVILVTKKDGSTRFCVDYRRLNKLTKISKYPLTNPVSCFEKLHNIYHFSKIGPTSSILVYSNEQRRQRKDSHTCQTNHLQTRLSNNSYL